MFASGQTVVLREVLHGRIRSARPLRVVADDDHEFVGFMTPRSAVAWPRLIDAEQSQTPDQGWRLVDETWQGPGSLFVIPAGEAFAAVLFFDPSTREPLSWKIDFMLPPRRTATGFDTLDTALDLLATLDRTSWTVKDTDDFAQLGRLGVVDDDTLTQVADARTRAEHLISSRSGPFDERWVNWRPEPSWAPLTFPNGWDDLDRPDTPTAAAQIRVRHTTVVAQPTAAAPTLLPTTDTADVERPIVVRSALGSEILDADGRVWHDFDLGGGTLLLGHNHPAIVEAVARQMSLLHRHPSGTVHEASVAVAERLRSRVGRGDRVRLTRSGNDAWRLAMTAGVDVHDARVDLGVGTTEPLVVFGEEHASGWPFGAVVGPSALIDALDGPAKSDRSTLSATAPEPDPLAVTAALETLHQLSPDRLAQLRNRVRAWTNLLAPIGESSGFRVSYGGGGSLRIHEVRDELPLSVILESRSIMYREDLILTLAETTSETAISTVTSALSTL